MAWHNGSVRLKYEDTNIFVLFQLIVLKVKIDMDREAR